MRSAVANDEPPYFWTIKRGLADNVGSAIGEIEPHDVTRDGELGGGVCQGSADLRGGGVIGAQTEDRRTGARSKRAQGTCVQGCFEQRRRRRKKRQTIRLMQSIARRLSQRLVLTRAQRRDEQTGAAYIEERVAERHVRW